MMGNSKKCINIFAYDRKLAYFYFLLNKDMAMSLIYCDKVRI